MNYSVLIVDDDDDDFLLFAMHTEQCQQNITLSFAENGVKAIEKLNGGLRPHLILVDAQMPIMNGHEFLVWLMKSPLYRRIPVIVWTGGMLEEDITRYYEAGANAVIYKPSSLRGVESFCKHWFELVLLPPNVTGEHP